MKGGKYLGSGTYGCIFYPAINCNDGSTPHGVGKIFADKQESDEEKRLGNKIESFDNSSAFTNPLIHTCKVSKKKLLKMI